MGNQLLLFKLSFLSFLHFFNKYYNILTIIYNNFYLYLPLFPIFFNFLHFYFFIFSLTFNLITTPIPFSFVSSSNYPILIPFISSPIHSFPHTPIQIPLYFLYFSTNFNFFFLFLSFSYFID